MIDRYIIGLLQVAMNQAKRTGRPRSERGGLVRFYVSCEYAEMKRQRKYHLAFKAAELGNLLSHEPRPHILLEALRSASDADPFELQPPDSNTGVISSGSQSSYAQLDEFSDQPVMTTNDKLSLELFVAGRG